MRVGRVERKTAETEIALVFGLDGTGRQAIDTNVPFLDHMLAQLSRHGILDLEVQARGDTIIDYHHTVEDIGICLGQALGRALADGAGIRRFGHAIAPLDEALVLVSIDISGRGYASVSLQFGSPKVGQFDTELVAEFLQAFALNVPLTLHVMQLRGQNAHHVAEATFKALGLALREAVSLDPRRPDLPSTKGALL